MVSAFTVLGWFVLPEIFEMKKTISLFWLIYVYQEYQLNHFYLLHTIKADFLAMFKYLQNYELKKHAQFSILLLKVVYFANTTLLI